ncbi:hypothetical protein KEM55_008576 [Ascosphaera atra]|nr:hypothetical protein KEM55_008576 [Ascosphaera atra]
MKDLLVFLSNVAHMIQIPGRDEAFCLLVFLLAFAPTTTDEGAQAAEAEKGAVEVEESAEGAKEKDKGAAASQTTPQPSAEKNSVATSSKPLDNKVIFASYNPSVHRYLPLAVDALAKLLARDDPNRTHLKTIFANDSATAHALEQHYTPDLLTRTFMLAIAPLPSAQLTASLASPQLLMLIEFRKPLLMQSLLAADVLASMLPMVAGGTGAPAYVSKMARSWLGGADGWASALGRIVALLLETLEKSPAASVNGMGVKQGMKGHEAVMAPPQAGMPYGTLASQPNVQQQMQDEPSSTLVSLVNRGLAILRRLAECAQTVTRKHANADVDGDHAMDEDQEDGDQDENDEETADTLSQENSKTLVNATASSRPNVPLSVFPRKERVVAALLTSHVDPSTLNNLCDLARIGVI